MAFMARCVVGILLRRLGGSGDWLCSVPSEPGAEPHHLDEVLVGELAGFLHDSRLPLFSVLQFFRNFFFASVCSFCFCRKSAIVLSKAWSRAFSEMNFPVSSTRPEDEAAELGTRFCDSSQADMATKWGFDTGRGTRNDLEPKLLRTDER